MPRLWADRIEYDGAGYAGWQRQTNGRSIQQALEEAVARLDSSARPRMWLGPGARTRAFTRGGRSPMSISRAYGTGWRLRAAINAHLS